MRRSYMWFGSAIGLAIIALAAYSYWVDPNWASQPGGFMATLGEAVKALIPLAASLFTIYKGVKELQKENKAKASQSLTITGDIAGSPVAVVGEGGTANQKVAGTIIEHVDTLYTGVPPAPTAAELVELSRFTILPPPVDFVGRETELNTLLEGFERGATIGGVTGGGGMGKTMLARALAAKLKERFPDGRLEINLQGTSPQPVTTADAMRALLNPFFVGKQLPADEQELHGLYLETFRNNTCLLLLDNAKDAQQVRGLLPQPPSAAIVTARANISLAAEGLRPLRLGVLRPEEARKLLREVGPRLEREPDASVDKLAELCGRLPLALRVAGALLERRTDWTVAGFLEKLGDERQRLKELKEPNDPDLDVEATLELSYASLEEGRQARYRALGIFPAPFELEAAAAVWGCESEEADRVLGELAYRNLVEWQAARREYGLHDLTRVHALSKLCEKEDEVRAALEAHAGYYLQEGRKADDEYKQGGEHVLQGIHRYRQIWPHLGEAWRRVAGEAGGWPEIESKHPFLDDFAGRMPNLLSLHLTARQRIPILEQGRQAAIRLKDRQAEGVHLGNLGNAYAALGEARRAIEYHEQALAIDREIGDRRGEGAGMGNLGNAYAALGETRRAIEYHEQALAIDREIGDRRGEGAVLGNLGLAYADLGETRRAIELYEQRLVIAREIGDRRGEGRALGNLGNAYKNLGETQRAIELYEQALAIDREIGDRRGEGNALGNLGNAYAALGEPRRAIELYEQQLVITREIGDRRGEGAALGSLGNAYFALGETRRAIEYHEQALAIDREIGDRQGEGQDLGNLGLAYAALGETQRAIELYEQQLVIAREIGDRGGEGRALGNLGNAYAALGEPQRAIELYEQQLVITREIGDRRGEGIGSWNLGDEYAKLGEFEKAAELMQVWVDYARGIGHPDAEKDAQMVEEVRSKARGEEDNLPTAPP